MSILTRVLFAFRHKTWGRIGFSPADPSHIYVYRKGVVVQLKRRCPHQGAPMEQGRIKGDWLVCPWHGYRFSLTGEPDRVAVPSAGRHE